MSECKCGRPTRDHAFACEACGDLLAQALGDVPWLDEQMEVTITRQQGIDYRRMGGGVGGKTAPRGDRRIEGDRTHDPIAADAPSLGAAIQPDPLHLGAAEARAHLRGLLVSWTRMAHDEEVRSSDPRDGLPEDNLPAISRWLLWRVDGLMLHEAAADVVDEITSAVAHCHRTIDRPPDRQYLGDCKESECDGRIYASPSAELARCDGCGTTTRADEIRAAMLKELDDRLCTAREIAELSTYLGLKAGREQVRKYVEYLSRKERITKHPAFSDQAVFRFGEVYELLIKRDYGTPAKQSA